jgi:hypothetical protein
MYIKKVIFKRQNEAYKNVSKSGIKNVSETKYGIECKALLNLPRQTDTKQEVFLVCKIII